MFDDLTTWRYSILAEEWNAPDTTTSHRARMLRSYFGMTIEPHGKALRITFDSVTVDGASFPLTIFVDREYRDTASGLLFGHPEGSRIANWFGLRHTPPYMILHRPHWTAFASQCVLEIILDDINTRVGIPIPAGMFDGLKEVLDSTATLSALQVS